ncbi:MAG: hypothetical protein AAGK74_00235 [Chloroflexota bacterium]
MNCEHEYGEWETMEGIAKYAEWAQRQTTSDLIKYLAMCSRDVESYETEDYEEKPELYYVALGMRDAIDSELAQRKPHTGNN